MPLRPNNRVDAVNDEPDGGAADDGFEAASGPVRHGRGSRIGLTLQDSNVVKTMWPGCPGTQRWQKKFGSSLVAVRYREMPGQCVRHVTVEIEVQSRPIRVRPVDGQRYGLLLWWGDTELIRAVKALGGSFDPASKLWMLDGKWVRQLGLAARVRSR